MRVHAALTELADLLVVGAEALERLVAQKAPAKPIARLADLLKETKQLAGQLRLISDELRSGL